jgi:putative DNA primase/helicase
MADISGALMRRLMPLHRRGTTHRNPDPGLKDRLTRDELGGVLRWALEGLRRLLERGKFDEKQIDVKLMRNMLRSTNPTAPFVLDNLRLPDTAEEGAMMRTSIQELFWAWRSFCQETSTRIVSNREGFVIDLMTTVALLQGEGRPHPKWVDGETKVLMNVGLKRED